MDKKKAIANVCSMHERNDVANAKAFMLYYGDRVKYVHAWQSWVIYNGRFWEQDETGIITRMFVDLLKDMKSYAQDTGNTNLHEWLQRSQNLQSIKAALEIARSYLGIMPNEFNVNKDGVNLPNGFLDLQTLELRRHDRRQYSTRIMNVPFVRDAECPTWDRFIKRIVPIPELREFLQRAIGYSLSGHIKEQVLFVLYGPSGSNGKSTLVEAIRYVFGDYAMATDSTLLLRKSTDSIRTDIARLHGARFVTAVEVARNKKLDEVIVKQLTGKDTIVARRLYEREQEIEPTWKLFLVTNDLPEIPDVDPAIRRRLRVLPFNTQIKAEEVDLDMLEKLCAEGSGILNWIIEGYRRWQTDGLGDNETVNQLTDAYVQEQDSLVAFIETQCVADRESKISKTRFYESYSEWCEACGYETLSKRAVGTAMKRLNYYDFSTREEGATKRFWNGLRLNIVH